MQIDPPTMTNEASPSDATSKLDASLGSIPISRQIFEGINVMKINFSGMLQKRTVKLSKDRLAILIAPSNGPMKSFVSKVKRLNTPEAETTVVDTSERAIAIGSVERIQSGNDTSKFQLAQQRPGLQLMDLDPCRCLSIIFRHEQTLDLLTSSQDDRDSLVVAIRGIINAFEPIKERAVLSLACVPIPRQLFQGVKVVKLTSKGQAHNRVLTVSPNRLTLFLTTSSPMETGGGGGAPQLEPIGKTSTGRAVDIGFIDRIERGGRGTDKFKQHHDNKMCFLRPKKGSSSPSDFEPNQCLSITFSGERTLDLMVASEGDYEQLAEGLESLIGAYTSSHEGIDLKRIATWSTAPSCASMAASMFVQED